MGQFDIQSTGLVGIRKPGLWNLKSGPLLFLINGLSTALQLKCTCFHAGSHFQKKTPSLWDAAVFRHQTTCLCFLFSSLHRRGPRLSANRRCFVSEVTEPKLTLNFGRSLCRPESSCPSELERRTLKAFPIGAVEFEAMEASGLCTGAKCVGCYWYSISSVTPKLLCIQRLCSKPRVSTLWAVRLNTRPAVLFHNHHRVLYYPGNKSITCVALGAFLSWYFNCASVISDRALTRFSFAHKSQCVNWFFF